MGSLAEWVAKSPRMKYPPGYLLPGETRKVKAAAPSAALDAAPADDGPRGPFEVPSEQRRQMTDLLAAKFTNIRKAFHHVDVNNDGVVSKEVRRKI